MYLGELLWHQRKSAEEASKHLFAAKRINAHAPVVLRAEAVLRDIQKHKPD